MREDAMRDLILAAFGTGEFVSLRQLADALGRIPELVRSPTSSRCSPLVR